MLKLSTGLPQYAMSRLNVRRELTETLESRYYQSPVNSLQADKVDILELLDHFMDSGTLWIGSPENQKTFQNHGIKLGLEAPYLLHAILAFSSSHIFYLRSDNNFRIAAAHHYDRLLALYTAQLPNICDDNIDHLFGTCNLHIMLAFFNTSVDHLDLFDDPEDHVCDFDAFKTLQGGSVLQTVPTFQSHLDQSVWRQVFLETEQRDLIKDTEDLNPQRYDLLQTIEALGILCGFTPDEQYSMNPYFEPIKRIMSRIVGGKMDGTSISCLFSLISKLSPAFMDLLERLDPKAMLILSYCFALLLEVPQWWTVSTARNACRRIVTYLYKTSDYDIQIFLQYPAAQCGLRWI